MDKFRVLTATAAPLMVPNIDTDAIIPIVWLRSLGDDQAKGLFARWRRDESGDERPDFVLNREPYRRARILVAGRNFGCGSSRENAVWALMAFGIRCVIAPSFADIFSENAAKNGLLTVPLPEAETERLAAEVEHSQGAGTVTVDLDACQVTTPEGRAVAFAVNPAVRAALLEGIDEIGRTLQSEARIRTFQESDRRARPWIYAVAD
jgi:3-isopropylmalate/(R)-2-methylmalate dehydratase small subunit